MEKGDRRLSLGLGMFGRTEEGGGTTEERVGERVEVVGDRESVDEGMGV